MISRWSIRQVRSVFVLEDARTGQRISWHRTISGALRKRREIIELRDELEIYCATNWRLFIT